MADTFLKIGTSFPQGAYRADPQNEDRLVLNIPSQAAADELSKQGTIQPLEGYQSGESRRSLVDWLAPEVGVNRDIAKDFIGGGSQNLGLGVADLAGAGLLDAADGWNYLKDMSQRNRDAEASVRQELIDEGYNTGSMDFFKELQRRLPEKESAGEAVFDFAFGGLELGLAAKLSFRSLGNFFKRFNGKANAVPTPEINVVPADTPQFGALAASQQQADAVSMAELDARLRAQQPNGLTDAEMDNALADLILDETDPEVLINDALLEREATGATFTPEDDQILNDLELTDADFSELDEANSAYDRVVNERIDIELASRPEYQGPSVQQGVQSLRAAGEPPSVIEKYLAGISEGYKPVYQISEAKNTAQLRELYARYSLPIPKTDAEERAADLIIQVATGEPIDQSMRRRVDLNYLKAHATPAVFDKARPTIQETLEAERQYGVLSDASVEQETDIGALSGAFGFYNRYAPIFSPSMRAAENLPQEKGSYKSLKAWMLKNGAKAKEMEWSGADEAFEGRTDVTKIELIQYLNENKDLVEAERKTAIGVLRSEGGDTRMAVENYIDDNLDSEAEMLRENFKDNWEYNNNMESIQDYVASENIVPLEMLIDEIDGIDTVEELIERFPEGYIGDPDMMGFRQVFEDADEASSYDANNRSGLFSQDALESLTETLNEMEQYDPEQYGRMIFGDDGGFADTRELEYVKYFPTGGTNTSETTYQFRDPTGRLADDYFNEPHFEETGRDTNLVAHVRTAEFPVDGGGTAYHVGEIQSDAAQNLRQKNTQTGEVTKFSPRTRNEEIQMGQIEYLSGQVAGAIRGAENNLNKIVFGEDVGLGTTFRRESYPEKLATYQNIIANFKNKQSDIDGFEGYEPDQIQYDSTFFGDAKGITQNMRLELDEFAQYIKDVAEDVPPEYVQWADLYIQDLVPKIDNLSLSLGKFGNQDLSETMTGAPFIESTDAWVGMTLRRQLADAIESGADYITLPNPEMVKKYTYGDIEGHRAFYGEIAPTKLLDIAKSYDPDATLVGKVIETSETLEAVTALPLTRRLVESIMDKGIPTYAVPLAVSTGAGYGALDQVGGQDGKSGS